MHQRTRVMQRNLRMVLILVDGKSTVADLAMKIGNQVLTESSLAELEAGGFIAPQVEQDSLWSESKKVAQEIRSAALNKAMQVVAPDKGEAAAATSAPTVDAGFSLPADSAFSTSAFPFPPMPFANTEKPVIPPVAEKPARPRKSDMSSEKAGGGLVKLAARIKGLFSGGEVIESAKVSIKPIRRGARRDSLTWSAVATIALLFLIVLGVLVVMFFPFNLFRTDVEAAIEQATGQPVTVGDIRGEIYPKPGLVLAHIKLGKDENALSIGEARLIPEVGTVFEPKIFFRQVVFSGVSLPAELVAGLPRLFSSLASPSSRFDLTSIRLEKTELSFAGLSLEGLEGEIQRDAKGLLQGVQLYSADRDTRLNAKPVGEGIEVELDALGWRSSEASRLVVSSANLRGVIDGGTLKLSDMELRIFDGVVKGIAVLRGDKVRTFSGEVAYERIDAVRLGEALGIGQLLSGSTSGNLRFSAISENWATIFSTMDADGAFSLDRGSIRGIDLPEAVRRVSRGPVQGGATQFEQFSGTIKVTDSGYQFSGISINSGLMQSSGSAEVGKDLKLKGKMELQMRGTANQMRVPVSLGGTLMVPEVRAGNN